MRPPSALLGVLGLRGTVVPSPGDRRHALRVAVGLAVPGLILLLAGRPDLIIYAAFGSFAGMYGRSESRPARRRHQMLGAAVLLSGVAGGIALSNVRAATPILVLTAVVFAAVASLVADLLRLQPAGPFFGIFALGAIATVPAGQVAPWVAMGIAAGTAGFCVLVGSVAGPRDDDAPAAAAAPVAPAAASASLLQAARYGLAIAVAGSFGLLLGVDHANWAMASAAVPLTAIDSRVPHRHGIGPIVHRGFHRVMGTLTGLCVTAVLLLPQFSTTVLAIAVMLLLFPTELFMAHHYGVALGFFTPLIMLMTELATPIEPWILVRDRAADTLIGVASGVAVAVLLRRQWLTRDGSVGRVSDQPGA